MDTKDHMVEEQVTFEINGNENPMHKGLNR